LSLLFLVLLETLSPVERAVFLLREVFDYRYGEIAEIVEKNEANCRQIFARARKQIDESKPDFSADVSQQRELTGTFLEAIEQGEIDTLLKLLAPDVVFTGDGGGKGGGLPEPVYGRERVARLLEAFATQGRTRGGRIVQAKINGQPGTLNFDRFGGLINVFVFEIASGQLQTIRSIINPDKLRHLGYPLSDVGRNPTSSVEGKARRPQPPKILKARLRADFGSDALRTTSGAPRSAGGLHGRRRGSDVHEIRANRGGLTERRDVRVGRGTGALGGYVALLQQPLPCQAAPHRPRPRLPPSLPRLVTGDGSVLWPTGVFTGSSGGFGWDPGRRAVGCARRTVRPK